MICVSTEHLALFFSCRVDTFVIVLRDHSSSKLLESGYAIRTVQELLGHKDVSTAMIYTHVLNKPGLAIRSPLDEERSWRGDHSISQLDETFSSNSR